MKSSYRIFNNPVLVAIFMTVIILAIGNPAFAQDDVDLSDNEVCQECHTDTEFSAPENSDKPRVHDDSGSFIQEDHDMWSCNDCHTDILEIPHREDITREVPCTDCHESTPE